MILKLTESDRLIGTVVEAAYYPMVVTKFNEPAPSSSKKSTSMFVEFQIADGKYKGKEFKVAFNTETSSPSILGNMIFMPWGFLYNLGAAALNLPIEQVSNSFDTDLILGKMFDGKVVKTISDGIPVNAIMGFLPLGTSASIALATTPF